MGDGHRHRVGRAAPGGPSAPVQVLLAIAAASFAVLLAASAWQAAAFPADLRGDLRYPGRAFTCFAFAAACGVPGDRLASDGHRYPAAALATAALLACCRRGRPRRRPSVPCTAGCWQPGHGLRAAECAGR